MLFNYIFLSFNDWRKWALSTFTNYETVWKVWISGSAKRPQAIRVFKWRLFYFRLLLFLLMGHFLPKLYKLEFKINKENWSIFDETFWKWTIQVLNLLWIGRINSKPMSLIDIFKWSLPFQLQFSFWIKVVRTETKTK